MYSEFFPYGIIPTFYGIFYGQLTRIYVGNFPNEFLICKNFKITKEGLRPELFEWRLECREHDLVELVWNDFWATVKSCVGVLFLNTFIELICFLLHNHLMCWFFFDTHTIIFSIPKIMKMINCSIS
jgi:hypothetical protein